MMRALIIAAILFPALATAQSAGDLTGSAPGETVAHISANVRLGDGAANYLHVLRSDSAAATGMTGYAGFAAEGPDPNINLVLAPRGGGVVFRNPQGSPTTGVPPGVGSVDLQPAVFGAGQGVAGSESFTAGYGNTVSSNNAVALGFNCTVGVASNGAFCLGYSSTMSGQFGYLFGRGGADHQRFNVMTFSPNSFAVNGDSMRGWMLLGTQGVISDTAAHDLTTDKAAYNVGLNGFKLVANFVHALHNCESLFRNQSTGAVEVQTLGDLAVSTGASTITLANASGSGLGAVSFTPVTPASPVVSLAVVKDVANLALRIQATASSGSWRGQVSCEFQDAQ